MVRTIKRILLFQVFNTGVPCITLGWIFYLLFTIKHGVGFKDRPIVHDVTFKSLPSSSQYSVKFNLLSLFNEFVFGYTMIKYVKRNLKV